MTYELFLSPNVQKFLRNLKVQEDLDKIYDALNQLAESPQQGKGLVGQLKGIRSWRVGKYRILYEIYEERVTILVLRINLRKKVYK